MSRERSNSQGKGGQKGGGFPLGIDKSILNEEEINKLL